MVKTYEELKESEKISQKKYYSSEKGKLTKKKYVLANKDFIFKYQKTWRDNNKARVREYCRRWREKHPERNRKAQLNFIANNPQKYKAYSKVLGAMRKGTLKRGVCEMCKDVNVEAHHPDYQEPLRVVWLCKKHHEQLHHERSD